MAVRATGIIKPVSAILPGTYTVDTLPDPAVSVDMYARVTDLFGGKRDLVLASTVGATAFWQPVRPVFAANMAVAADATLTALKMPSVMFLSGTLGTGITRTLSLSNTLAFPGASFRIKNAMSGLGTLRIGNVNLGTPVSIIFSAVQEFVYDLQDGWKQIT